MSSCSCAWGVEMRIAPGPRRGSSELARLRELFAPPRLDVEILKVVSLALDLDSRFERFYGYLHDDAHLRRRPSVGLARAGRRRPAPAEARKAVHGPAPLRRGVRPSSSTTMTGRFLTRAKCPDRVTDFQSFGSDDSR